MQERFYWWGSVAEVTVSHGVIKAYDMVTQAKSEITEARGSLMGRGMTGDVLRNNSRNILHNVSE